jgi:hypothetical protein
MLLFACLVSAWSLKVKLEPIVEDQHHIFLAKSLLNGNLHISYRKGYGDLAVFNNHYFLMWPPLPSVLLMPAVLFFGDNFNQFWLTFFSVVVSFFLAYKITRQLKLSEGHALIATIFLFFGTVYLHLFLLGFSSYLGQIVGTMFVLAALNEYFSKKRWLAMGILVALAFLSRFTLIFASLFFILSIFKQKSIDLKKQLIYFISPIVLAVLIVMSYNFARFSSIWETGQKYGLDPVVGPSGVFSLAYLPNNVYHFLFMGPEMLFENGATPQFPYLQADLLGLGILFVSPLLLLIFSKKEKRSYTPALWLTSLVIMLPSLFFYNSGGAQFGYRYFLDALPFIYILLLLSLKQQRPWPTSIYILIFYSILFNFLIIPGIWRVYL